MQWHMPIGYKVVDGKITICEEQRKIVEQIFTDYDSGVAAGRIAQNLKGRNICNAKGKVSWTHASIGRILENPSYLGTEYYPQLIGEELFERVQRRREKVRAELGRADHRPGRDERILFGGVIWCAECGAVCSHIQPNHKKERGGTAKWKCRNYVTGRAKNCRKKMKVAAYCRVSTELEEQDSSYEAQVEYYTSKISENENWKNAGIYADDGKSGTNTKKRADFNAMIQDALAGKIDMILTKSVSRFARNTVDSLVTIRKLKEKNVAVVFEKEGINTLEGTGEILITILSSLAQEESRNISENIRWGVVRKFEKGKVIVNCTKFMGYTKNEDGDLVIVPEEAEIVKLIFRLYLEGYSTGKIAKHLEEQGIKTATGQDKWHSTVIDKMLRNEKYMGDALLQKTYTVDFMTKKKVKNTGIVPQYYVEDDHEAIIPKELFYRVQEEMMRRASLCKAAVTRKKNQRSRYSSTYALTGMLICGKCGQEYRRVTWARNGKKKVVWRCSNRLTNGVKKCGESETLEENTLNRAVMEAIHRITSDDMEFMENFRQNIIHVIGNYSTAKESEEYEEKIKEKQEEMVALIAENAKTGSYTPEFDERYRTIAEEINALKEAQKTARNEKWMADSYEQRIQDIDHYLSTSTCQIQEFDNDLVRRLISTIKVESSEKLLIQFQSGIVMEQEIRYE